MLLKEFLKEHQKVKGQQSTIRELKAAVARQRKRMEALITRLRKVTARIESARPAPRVVSDD
jgi:uncharacterized coiled-coil protein SlyX